MGAWVFALRRDAPRVRRAGRRRTGVQPERRREELAAAAPPARRSRLSEFAIDPSMIAVDTGGSLTVKNGGTVDAQPRGQGHRPARPPTSQPGESATPRRVVAEDGHVHRVLRDPRPRGAGHDGDAHVGMGGAHAARPRAVDVDRGRTTSTTTRMKKPVDEYVAQLDERRRTPRASARSCWRPTVLPDGTKQFDLTAEIVDWEVEPGKTVQAWTYNGTVPGPTIKVARRRPRARRARQPAAAVDRDPLPRHRGARTRWTACPT